MAEIQLTRIKSIYGDIKGLLSQIPLSETNPLVDSFTVNTFNEILDELSRVSHTDFSGYKIPPEKEHKNWPGSFDSRVVRAQIGRVVSRLEQEYNFEQVGGSTTSPGIVIFNKNQNEVSLQINYTINDLIEQSNNEESKSKLKELKDELDQSDKNWEVIKNIIIWIINFSKELFLKIIPIILEKKI